MRAAIVLALLVASGSAGADEILYSRDGALHRHPIDGEASVLVPLPAAATDLQLAGRTVIVSTETGYYTLDLEADTPTLRSLICFGAPAAAADGRITCPSGTGGTLVIDPTTGSRTVVAANPAGARLVGDRLIAATADGLVAIGLEERTRTQLAPHRPDSALMVAPDGSRAIGLYPDGDATAIFAARLDGIAARRKLISKTAPVAWSADSAWLVVQRGTRACIVRAVGGEYKCWKRYQARAIAADGSWALVTRDGDGGAGFDLYRAELSGARPARPRPVAEGIDGPALWLSSPASQKSAP